MEIDAELRRQITVSLAAAAVFTVGLVGIGVTFGGSTVLPEAGAIALIGLLAGFVLLMAGIGTYLMRAKDEP
ncbi:hypothetical protein DJ83_02705 [Halorubrum ezzemoulense]|jgi:hypothetical protein|uniref:Transporter n=2 Tax=Halorubrum ezzemoulense TaxID=337243 RepID=A0A256J3R9_HALEZ|nr:MULTISPECIES: hypothetical protein [Halorubrum]MDB2238398.1 hypothetical protein [Halorubrum ezzemoulense]MDB2247868.1 hypothetical protein [Halorubrum ezzemoulense]MDB2252436.1 hypothetical protein [Halorubrum ezzemoulense]MDB2260564.1 hypothetical protein [Halorubrum ezzemoulense]MDB2265013.1 hypothetical protein [Halorubrum ezzemoulense]